MIESPFWTTPPGSFAFATDTSGSAGTSFQQKARWLDRVVPAIRLLWRVEVVVAGIARRIAEEVAAARSALHVDAMDRKGRGPVREPCRTVVAGDRDRHGAAGRLAVARDRDPVIEAELAAVVVRGLSVGDDWDDAVCGRRAGGVHGRCRLGRQDPRLTGEERQRRDRSQESRGAGASVRSSLLLVRSRHVGARNPLSAGRPTPYGGRGTGTSAGRRGPSARCSSRIPDGASHPPGAEARTTITLEASARIACRCPDGGGSGTRRAVPEEVT